MNGQKKTTPAIAVTPDVVRAAVGLPGFDAAAAHAAMSPSPRPLTRPADRPGSPRVGAVLVVLYCREGAPHTILIRRRDDLKYHPGQISFPGGRQEHAEELLETALREAREEVGLCSGELQILGPLAPVYISPSDFVVHPFVAWHGGLPQLRMDAREVAEILETPLEIFLAPEALGHETRAVPGGELAVPFYRLGRQKVWGATAMIVNELIARLRAAGA